MPRELTGWAVRGLLCALPSVFFAAMIEFTQPIEIAAMVTGVALYVIGFALFCSWRAMSATAGRARFLRALKVAGWIKSALLVGAAGYVLPLTSFNVPQFVVMPDMLCGMLSLALVGSLAGVDELGRLDSFVWTGLTTVVQGIFIALMLVLLALVVLGVWKLAAVFRRDT